MDDYDYLDERLTNALQMLDLENREFDDDLDEVSAGESPLKRSENTKGPKNSSMTQSIVHDRIFVVRADKGSFVRFAFCEKNQIPLSFPQLAFLSPRMTAWPLLVI
jgi:hypothetical protein